MILAFTTQGQMKYQDILKECKNEKWTPLLIFRLNGERILPVFKDHFVCKRFLKRNLPKDWLSGCVELTSEDIVVLDKAGFKAKKFDFPNKIKDIVEFDIHIHEFVDTPDVFRRRA